MIYNIIANEEITESHEIDTPQKMQALKLHAELLSRDTGIEHTVSLEIQEE